MNVYFDKILPSFESYFKAKTRIFLPWNFPGSSVRKILTPENTDDNSK